MDEGTGAREGRNHATRSPSLTTVRTALAGATGLLVGMTAISFLAQASPEAVAATTSVALISGLACLLLMAYLVAMRPLPRPHGGGGPDTRPPRPTTIRPARDPDAELRRILGDARLGDLTPARRSRADEREAR
jgi:hypothetical protein